MECSRTPARSAAVRTTLRSSRPLPPARTMVSLARKGAVADKRGPGRNQILKGSPMNSKSVAAVLAALAVGTALVVPSPASAQTVTTEEHNTYVAVKFGPYFPSETNGLNACGNTFNKWPTKYAIDA